MGGLFETLMQFLKDAFLWFVELLFELCVDLANALMLALAAVLDLIVSLLPSGCFLKLENFTIPEAVTRMAGHINWFIPMDAIINTITIIACMYTAYFVTKPILKFIHAS